jgi:hypothetical protein
MHQNDRSAEEWRAEAVRRFEAAEAAFHQPAGHDDRRAEVTRLTAHQSRCAPAGYSPLVTSRDD